MSEKITFKVQRTNGASIEAIEAYLHKNLVATIEEKGRTIRINHPFHVDNVIMNQLRDRAQIWRGTGT